MVSPVGEAATEQLLGAVDGQVFGDVDVLAATVVALARVAFGVFVGQDRALRLHHGAGDDVFGRDEFDLMTLATKFLGDGAEQLGVARGQGFAEKAGVAVGCVHRRVLRAWVCGAI
jgi:hypothetical protein